MTKFKHTFMALVCAVLAIGAVSCSDDDDSKDIAYNSLPEAARSFITTYFAGDEVATVKNDPKSLDETYVATLKSGAKIHFTAAGQWTEVDMAPGKAIPAGIMLNSMEQYISTNFPQNPANEVQRIVAGYKVELISGMELYFDPSGAFISFDID